MREILFRAKTTKGKWVYGYPNIYDDESINFVVGKLLNSLLPMEDCCVNIEYDTLGQYTGLTDKNGKKIFEGDIVKAPFYYDIGCYPHTETKIIEVKIPDIYKIKVVGHFEVIGNIFDNEELLGE